MEEVVANNPVLLGGGCNPFSTPCSCSLQPGMLAHVVHNTGAKREIQKHVQEYTYGLGLLIA